MSGSASMNYILGTVFILLAALRMKQDCQLCFIGLTLVAGIFLIFGFVKYVQQRNG